MTHHGVAVTVFLPTFNGARYLREILSAIFAQECERDFEVLAIDSGSTDGTLEILAAYPEIRLIEIPNAQFQHGRTRNLAAAEARGRIVVYLTQSATPAHGQWLQRLTSHFEGDDSVVASYGRHLPRPGSNPYVAQDVERTFQWISPGNETRFDRLESGVALNDLPRSERDRRRFFSNANSAVRRSFLRKHPFREVEYAEDQLFGVDLLEAGFTKVYDVGATVFHSHGYPLSDYFRRRFDEYRGLIAQGEIATPEGPGRLLARAAVRWVRTLRWLARSRDYSVGWQMTWAVGALPFALADSMAQRSAQSAVAAAEADLSSVAREENASP